MDHSLPARRHHELDMPGPHTDWVPCKNNQRLGGVRQACWGWFCYIMMAAVLVFLLSSAIGLSIVLTLQHGCGGMSKNSDGPLNVGNNDFVNISSKIALSGFTDDIGTRRPFGPSEGAAFTTAIAEATGLPTGSVRGLHWDLEDGAIRRNQEDGGRDTGSVSPDDLLVSFDLILPAGASVGHAETIIGNLLDTEGLSATLEKHGLVVDGIRIISTGMGPVTVSIPPSGGGGTSSPKNDETGASDVELSALDVAVLFPSGGSLGRKILQDDGLRSNPADVDVIYVRIRRCGDSGSCPSANDAPSIALHPAPVGNEAFYALRKVFDGEKFVWKGRIGKLTPDSTTDGSETRVYVDAATNPLDGYSSVVDGFGDAAFEQSLRDSAGLLFSGVSQAITLSAGQTHPVAVVLKEVASSTFDTDALSAIAPIASSNDGVVAFCDVNSEDCQTGGGTDGTSERMVTISGRVTGSAEGPITYEWVVEGAAEGGVSSYSIGRYNPGGVWSPCGAGNCQDVCDDCGDLDVSIVFTSPGCADPAAESCSSRVCLLANGDAGSNQKECTEVVIQQRASNVGIVVQVQSKPYVSGIVAYEDDSKAIETGHLTAEADFNQYCDSTGQNDYEHKHCGISCQETLYLEATVVDPDTSGDQQTSTIDYQWYSDCAHFPAPDGSFIACTENDLSAAADSSLAATCRGQTARAQDGSFRPLQTTVKQVGTSDGYRSCVVHVVFDDNGDGSIDLEDAAHGTALSGRGTITLNSDQVFIHELSKPSMLDLSLQGHVDDTYTRFLAPAFSNDPVDQSDYAVFNTNLEQHFMATDCFEVTAAACAIVGAADAADADVESTDVFQTELVDSLLPISGQGSVKCRLRMVDECQPKRVRISLTQANTAGDTTTEAFVDIACGNNSSDNSGNNGNNGNSGNGNNGNGNGNIGNGNGNDR